MNEAITIRRAQSIADYRACQQAQRLAWGISEDGYVVPVATMVGAQLHGGLVLGAFLPDGQAVGLSFAFLGKLEGRLCLYSQLTGVVPGYQGQGIGLDLKRVQWDYARSEGLALLAWAFDPLQAGNAHFNLEKLGATAGRFIENMYGLRTDALNEGVPTDRLIAEWTTTERPRHDVDSDVASLPRVFETSIRSDGLRTVAPVASELAVPRILLEIPEDISQIRKTDPRLADAWSHAVRSGFTRALSAGFRACGFVRVNDGSARRCFYVLERAGGENRL